MNSVVNSINRNLKEKYDKIATKEIDDKITHEKNVEEITNYKNVNQKQEKNKEKAKEQTHKNKIENKQDEDEEDEEENGDEERENENDEERDDETEEKQGNEGNDSTKCGDKDDVEKKKLAQPKQVFDTNLDYDKKIFTMFKIIISNLIQEFKQLDMINNKLYNKDTSTCLLTREGYIRITDNNLGLLIRTSLNKDIEENLSFGNKLQNLSQLFSKTLISQNKLIIKTRNFYDVSDVDGKDITHIINIIMVKDDSNNYQLKKKVDLKRLKILILKLLEKLPIILMRHKSEVKSDVQSGYDLINSEKKESRNNDDEDLFITKKNAKKLRELQPKVFGPMKIEKDRSKPKPSPGQGRKSATTEGVEEKTDIFDTTSWPSTCK
jgi:hypothetical protein